MQKIFTNFSLYVHIPFCARKCLFCSFVIAVGQEHRREEYVKALINEMQMHRGKNLQTIYFGGGTPSSLDEKHFDELMSEIRKNFTLNKNVEITFEANPESINFQKAKFLKSLGFTRVSLGLQSTKDRFLKFLGRNHDASLGQRAYEGLREAGFDNINVDLMYGFPGESVDELREDVQAIGGLGSEHLSLYSLTIEPNSRFFITQVKLDDEERLAQQYSLIAPLLSAHGFEQYEISNFSKPGFQSAHNKNYWLGGAYLGVGMGAHGFDGRRRSWNVSQLKEYLQRADRPQELMEDYEDLTDEQLLMEKILFGLRMNQGIDAALIPANRQTKIKEFMAEGFLFLESQCLKVTDKGRLVLDELSSRLI